MDAVIHVKRLRNKLNKYRHQAGLCHYCQEPMNPPKYLRPETINDLDATYEHLIPKSKGGRGKQHNRVLVHRICNILHGRITSYLINIMRKSINMDDFIKKACIMLHKECVDYADSTQYVSEITIDVKKDFMTKLSDQELNEKILNELKKVYNLGEQ